MRTRLDIIVEDIKSALGKKLSKVILFGSYARGDWVRDRYFEGHIMYSYESDIDILIVLKGGANLMTQEFSIIEKVEKASKQKESMHAPHSSYIVASLGVVNDHLRKGKYFYSDIKKEGILLYDDGQPFLEKEQLSNKEKREMAQVDYDVWIESGERFLISAIREFRDKIRWKSAFELHQAAEGFYNTILLVFTGYKPKTHDLKKLKTMVNHHDVELLKIFPFDTTERKQCFKLLREAYIKARYDRTYSITEEQLAYLIGRITKLQEVTKKICLAKIESYK